MLQSNQERKRHEIKITLAPTQERRQQGPKMTVCWWLRKSAVKIRAGGGIQEGQAWERRYFQTWGSTIDENESVQDRTCKGEHENTESARKTKTLK